MAKNEKDIRVLRELATQYMELVSEKNNGEKRRLWSAHLSKKSFHPLVYVSYGMWNLWCKEVFSDSNMKCEDPLYREFEQFFRMNILHGSIGDDNILEPWLEVSAEKKGSWDKVWGVEHTHKESPMEGGAFQFDPPIKKWEDVAKLKAPDHYIFEKETQEKYDKVSGAVGDIMTVDLSRKPICSGFLSDISYCITQLRGLQQLMMDMYDSPEELASLLSFMREGILNNQKQAEEAGDYSLTSHDNQCLSYCDELEWPKPNTYGKKRKELWGFFAAQEYTLISPEMHDEFMLKYQLPIIKNFGLVHYGCCEDLTKKIDMLRQIPNLRIIAVTPVANVQKCAEQIKTDYVISWRPNPTDMICSDFNETRIRKILREGLAALKGTYFHIHLKDVETLQGDLGRLSRWVRIVREELDRAI
jgi:hypothetical protein